MKDFIIVGFGLAGLNLVFQLQKQHKSFVVIDNASQQASKIAGGISNPLILKRFTKAWKADEFIPIAEKTYRELEHQLQINVFYPTPIYRKIKSAREQNDWFSATEKPALKPFMCGTLKKLDPIPSKFDYGQVKNSSFLNTRKLIEKYAQILSLKDQFRNEFFNYKDLEIEDESFSYQGLRAQKIVFCEGFGMRHNPFFKTLPLIGNKGEYLLLKIPELNLKGIIKTAVTLIPLGNDFYKFGATYTRNFKNQKPEAHAREFLIAKLEEIIHCPYTIIETQVGIRPTVLDRRPLIGNHPQYKNMLILNGLGSHGVMIAPTAAQWLIASEYLHKPLPKEVDVKRYYHKKRKHLNPQN